MSNKIIEHSIHFGCGLALSLGFGISGMSNANIVISFFTPSWLMETKREWDPRLGIVFCSALGTHALIYNLVKHKLKKPIFAQTFATSTLSNIETNLVLGSTLFGIGWALGGYCPGPATISIVSGLLQPLSFTLSMVISMIFARFYQKKLSNKFFSILSSLVVLAAFYFWRSSSSVSSSVSSSFVPPLTLQTSLYSVFGGILIGSSIGTMFLTFGKILGISGMFSNSFVDTDSQKSLRLTFLVGLLTGAEFFFHFYPQAISSIIVGRPLFFSIFGGLLVGFGTTIANGCTSGHGICGLTRFSPRSIVATLTFMLSNFLTTSLLSIYQY
eukprot:TRINITY_DN187_c0_g2_i1.p1 TRINITY_DN187_c0_g2~~TRINITY_DN187_c0_g2_i1.p1  ORF type:complete len:328 (-),score=111.29 TRINITY_DN187_c0_g2_i1:82-1065(-)